MDPQRRIPDPYCFFSSVGISDWFFKYAQLTIFLQDNIEARVLIGQTTRIHALLNCVGEHGDVI